MKGQLLIDELDMYTKHGISIIKGSYNNLVDFERSGEKRLAGGRRTRI